MKPHDQAEPWGHPRSGREERLRMVMRELHDLPIRDEQSDLVRSQAELEDYRELLLGIGDLFLTELDQLQRRRASLRRQIGIIREQKKRLSDSPTPTDTLTKSPTPKAIPIPPPLRLLRPTSNRPADADVSQSNPRRSRLPRVRSMLGQHAAPPQLTQTPQPPPASKPAKTLGRAIRASQAVVASEPTAPVSTHDQAPPVARKERPKAVRQREEAEGDWQIAVRWWNLVPLVSLAATVMLGIGYLSFDRWQTEMGQLVLANELRSPTATLASLTEAAGALPSSWSERYDAGRSYLLARAYAQIASMDPQASHAPANLEATQRWLNQAVRLAPGNPWYRLTRASMTVPPASPNEPNDWEQLAQLHQHPDLPTSLQLELAKHELAQGDRARGIAMLRPALLGDPAGLPKFLSEAHRLGLRESETLAIVPQNAVTMVSVCEWLAAGAPAKRADYLQTHVRPWLTQNPAPASANDAEEWAARGELWRQLSDQAKAAEAWNQALSLRPGNVEGMSQLAHILYEKEDYDACAQWVDKILNVEADGPHAETAHLLRERLQVVKGRRPKSSDDPRLAPPPPVGTKTNSNFAN